MASRVIVAVCSVAASVGLLLIGMATSYHEHDSGMLNLGLVLMIGGVVGTIGGGLWYRAQEHAAEIALAPSETRGPR